MERVAFFGILAVCFGVSYAGFIQNECSDAGYEYWLYNAGSCYFLKVASEDSVNYKTASDNCANFRTDRGDISYNAALAVAENEAEWDYLKTLVPAGKHWLGCQRETDIQCENSNSEHGASKSGYWPWNADEPAADTSFNCLGRAEDGFKLYNCEDTMPYICEIIIERPLPSLSPAPPAEIYFLQNQTSQSSSHPDGASSKAVDGNTDGVFGNGFCSHTEGSGETNPWWRVDMTDSQCVGRVVIYNRVDCCGERLLNATVRVGDDADTINNPVFGTVPTADSEIELTNDLRGRYISVHSADTILQICEIKAYQGNCLDAANNETATNETATNETATNETVRVVGDPSIRLKGAGFLESSVNSTWYAVCDDGWDAEDAKVTCTGLGYQLLGDFYEGLNINSEPYFTNIDCSNNATEFEDCTYEVTTSSNCTGAGLFCLNEDSVTFSLGDSDIPNEGSVLIEYDGGISYVCDNDWDIQDANVLCRSLGFDGAVNITSPAGRTYDDGYGFFLDNVNCTGDESSLLFCTHSGFGRNECTNDQVASVVCNGTVADIRVIEDPNLDVLGAGVLETNQNGVWSAVCDQGWDPADAKVACTQLGFPLLGDIYDGLDVDSKPYFSNLDCANNATRLDECAYEVSGSNCSGAGILCLNDDSVTFSLGDSENPMNGSVLMEYNSRFAYVCDNGWDINAAHVVCRSLGFDGASDVTTGGSYGDGYGFFLDNVNCTGDESSLLYCTHDGFGNRRCNTDQVAGVVCSDDDTGAVSDIRVVDDPELRITGAGLLETNQNGTWSAVCDDGFDPADAKVACTQLGFPLLADYYTGLNVNSEPYFTNLNCSDNATRLDECAFEVASSNCTGAGVICLNDDSVTLSLGDSDRPNEGSVLLEYDSGFAYVCDNDWDINDAHVVCRSLGFDGASDIKTGGTYNDGYGFFLDNVNCTGDESSLLYCTHSGFGRHSCNSDQVAGVVCETTGADIRVIEVADLRLKGAGAVETYSNGTWYSVCDDGWDPEDAKVACTQLGYQLVADIYYGLEVPGDALFSNLDCTISESRLDECSYERVTSGNCSGAGLLCLNDTSVTFSLGDSDSDSSGTVIIGYDGALSYVCDDDWDINDAHVVCRSLGFEGATDITTVESVEDGYGFFLNNVNCTGEEDSLMYCVHSGFGTQVCAPGQAAGVVCQTGDEGTVSPPPGIRFRDSDQYIDVSVVETYKDGKWYSVCDQGWDPEDAKIACTQHGYPLLANLYFELDPVEPFYLTNLDCAGGEAALEECTYEVDEGNCTGAAGILCLEEDEVQFRLGDSYKENEGNVLVKRGTGAERYICDDNWDMQDANVICNMLGFAGALEVKVGAEYGQGSGFSLDDVNCTGDESNLLYCVHSGFGTSDCQNGEVAGVVCTPSNDTEGCDYCASNPCGYGAVCTNLQTGFGYTCEFESDENCTTRVIPEVDQAVRLVGGATENTGLVEVYYNGKWGPVCGNDFGIEEGWVVCYGLGYQLLGQVYVGVEGWRAPLVDGLQCTGDEESLVDCPHDGWGVTNCTMDELIGVTCLNVSDVVFSLEGGPTPWEGNVMVNYKGRTGTICDDEWDIKDAEVICRQLGFDEPIEVFTKGTINDTEIFMDDINCAGDEANVLSCEYNGWENHNCDTNEVAGVKCAFKGIRLQSVDTKFKDIGQVQMYEDGTWYSVCDDSWDVEDGKVACTQLGYPLLGNLFFQNEIPGEDILTNVTCIGNETALSQCDYELAIGECTGAALLCLDDTEVTFTLADGNSTEEGNVIVNYQGGSGYVCDDHWDQNAADVVCRQMGFKGATTAYSESYFGPATSDYFLDNVNCDGTEENLLFCEHGGFLVHDCVSNETAGVTCDPFQDGEVRLTQGDDRNGRLEVYYAGDWGTVCDDSFDMRDAKVACRQLGFNYANTYTNGPAGEGRQGPIWLDELDCEGTEDSLADCNGNPWGDTNCVHTEDVFLSCLDVESVEVRLADGDERSGRVEVNYGGEWGTICDDLFDIQDAQVVCRSAGLPGAISFAASGAGFGTGTGPIHLDDLGCYGTEESLLECKHKGWGVSNCFHSEDISVICEESKDPKEGSVRLIDGPDESTGRLEIFHNEVFGSVCDDEWDVNKFNNARVVCNQLGYTYVNIARMYTVPLGAEDTSIWLDNVKCVGTEIGLIDCSANDWEVNDCTHYEDVGVSCLTVDNVDVRLVDGESEFDGRVEVFYDEQWGTVCDDKFDMQDATVICKMLGSDSPIGFSSASGGDDIQPIWLDDLSCTGNETTVLECLHAGFGKSNCRHKEDISVNCSKPEDGAVKLVGGKDNSEGRVEVFHDGVWGTICDDEFGIKDAQVICRQLGFDYANRAFIGSTFGEGEDPTWIDNLECTGDENSVAECPRNEWGDENCGHTEDVGVSCFSLETPFEVRLDGGNDTNEGRVEVNLNGEWGTICDDLWDLNDAKVVCRQLGYFTATEAPKKATFGEGIGRILLDDVECEGDEESLITCSHREFGESNCEHNEDAGVVCANAEDGTLRRNAENGRLEVYYFEEWGAVCDDNWGNNFQNLQVACRELTGGLPDYWAKTAQAIRPSDSIWLDGVLCNGDELSLADCTANPAGETDCTHEEDVSVFCLSPSSEEEFDVRLVDDIGDSLTSGRVEVFVKGEWGTVCDDEFGLEEANVVCRSMGYSGADDFQVKYGGGNGTIWFDNLECSGEEPNLLHCLHAGIGKSNCDHIEDVGVTCTQPEQESVRLVDGRVEVFHDIEWGTVCDDNWDHADAVVVCRQLGYKYADGAFGGYSNIPDGTGKIWLDNVECDGTEERLADCQSNGWGNHNCGHAEDAGVGCVDDDDVGGIRLTGGAADNEGRIELEYQGQWWAVCDDSWDVNDANVACKQLGFDRGAETHTSNSQFSSGPMEIVLDDLECSGQEDHLLECSHGKVLTDHNCGDSEHAGAICIPNKPPTTGDAQLYDPQANTTGGEQGIVQVFYEGEYGTVCNTGWDFADAFVVCNSLGFLGVENHVADLGEGTGDILLESVGCEGTEESLANCTHSGWNSNKCDHSQDVAVICRDEPHEVRLVNDGNQTESQGRVEIQHNGKWGTICDDNWSKDDANVVCKQLGYPRALAALGGATWGQGTEEIILDEVKCTGEEDSLTGCVHSGWGEHNCDHNEDAGVICDDGQPLVDVRLVDGSAPNEGRVELKIVDEWGTACDDKWNIHSANVICRMLGYPGAAKAPGGATFGQGTGPILLDETVCAGDEDTIDDCEHTAWTVNNCKHHEDAGVVCFLEHEAPVPVRLADGASPSEGRVELYFNGEWGTVCDDSWDLNDANVVCNSLGHNGAIAAVIQGGFDQGTGQIFLDDVECDGDEGAIEECNHKGFGENNCGHAEDAGVQCREYTEGEVRLVGGASASEGRVEVYHEGAFGTICDDSWDLADANVVCKQLGYPGAEGIGGFNEFPGADGVIWMDEVSCVGKETAITICDFPGWGINNCGHAEDASVRCLPALPESGGTKSPVAPP